MKQVALTFDDGPNGEYTLQTLQILKTNDIKAAFFFPAKNVERQPEIAKRTLEEGHLIGNHTYDHPHLSRLKPDEIRWQAEKSENIFKEVLGIKPKLFRPPYGDYNDEAKSILEEKKYTIVDWDMDCYSRDWRDISSDEIVDIATKKAQDGSILLLHDGRNIRETGVRKNAVEALPGIIRVLRKRGFDIVRLDELLCRKQKE
ncbi:MAG: polysaccharide deacetylase family protein [Candidatus Omnitrophica bacterium]|nr:polysaccharide deacetylase family protein [Candidatus Omnitrophota bacterium]